MSETPERFTPRQVTVYDRERQCLAPGCGKWFTPALKAPRHRWCSKICKLRAYRAGLAFHVKRILTD